MKTLSWALWAAGFGLLALGVRCLRSLLRWSIHV